MLHILLTILKMIGIIILTLIGIIALLILLIIFTPLKYELKGDSEGDLDSLKLDARFSFFVHLITVNVQYFEQNLSWQLRIAWKKISSKNDTSGKELETHSAKHLPSSDDKKPTKKQIGDNDKKTTTSIKNLPENNASSDASKILPEKENKTDKDDSSLSDKIDKLINKIKCTFSKICDMIYSVKEKKDLVIDFLNEEHHRAAFLKLLTELKKLIKKLKPKSIKGTISFGFDDPSITGKVLGGISLIYPYIQKNLTINADFENKTLVGDLYIKGKVRISMFLALLLNLIMNKNVRITISHILKLIKTLKQGGN